MKMTGWIFLAILCFTVSHAAERNVTGNTFRSSEPSLNIHIDQEFRYLGKTDNLKSGKTEESYEDYVFLPKDIQRGGQANRYVFIQIRTREKAYKDSSPENLNNLDFGAIKLDEKVFKYFKRLTRTAPNSLSFSFLKNQGYMVPTCIMTNSFYTFPDKNTRIGIFYNEVAAPLGMSCDSKYSREGLSENQRRNIAEFHKRAFASIGIGVAASTKQVAVAKQLPSRKDEDSSLKQKETAGGAGIHARLSVFNFKPGDIDAVQYGTEVTFQLADALKAKPSLSILDRRDLDEFLRLNELQQNDNMDNVVNIGRRLGLNYVVTGRIEKKGIILVLTCFVVDVTKAEIAYRDKVQILGEGAISSSVKKLGDNITAAISKRP